MEKKGIEEESVYPYEYFDSFETFKGRQIPPKEEFCSSLRNENITQEDYEFVQELFTGF